MSFDFGPMQNLSNVQASAKTCAGGGGNTGYFSRNGEKEEEKIDFSSAKDYPDDSFERQGTLDEIQNQTFLDIIKNILMDLIEAIKGLFSK